MAETDPNKPPNLTDAQWNAMMLAQPPRPTIPTRSATIPPPQPATIPGPTPPPAMPIGAIPAATIPDLAKPTPKESRAAGKEEFERGMPTVTAAPGTPQYGEQRQQVADYEKAHPLGADVSAKPGFWGKLEHGLAKAGNIAGDIIAPGTMALIPGTDLNKQLQAKGNAAWTRLGSETELQNAQTEKAKADVPLEQAEAWKDLNPQAAKPGSPEEQVYAAEIAAGKSPEEALAAATKKAPTEGKSAADQLYAAEVVAGKSPEEAFAATQKAPTPNEEEKSISDYLQGRNLPDTPANRDKARDTLKTRDRTPRAPTDREEWQRDHPNEPIENYWKAKSLASSQGKPTADEQRRADLAENLTENLNALDDIAKRRPELFGPLAGRWAELKQKFGTDDADLAQLQVIEHQVGMAQISAHGMRSAQGIESAAQSIMNNLHNGAGAVLASTQAVRNSIKTFTQDVEKKTGKTEEAAQGGAGGHSFSYNGQRYENVPDALYQKYKSKPGFKEE
jgi:hypothetical protein